MAVMAILASLAAPSFTRMMASNRMSTQTNEFTTSLNAAKSEAIRRGQAVTLRAQDDANPNDFQRGWRTFTDEDTDGSPASPVTMADGTILRDNAALAGSTTVKRVTRAGTAPSFTYPAATSTLSSRQYITFTARGGTTASGAAFFRICDSANPGIPGRIVQVSLVGRVSIESTTENCSS
jgi:type IV fimbrial biogenesis protein FimT